MPLAKPSPAHEMRRSLRCVALRDKTGRLRRRKSCRQSRSATKRMAQSRNPPKVRQKKRVLHRSRSVKARASGAAAVVAEEADATVLLIAAHKIRQPAIVASRKSHWKRHQKSTTNRNRKAAQNRGTSGMKAVRNRGLRDGTIIAQIHVTKIGAIVMRAGRSNTLNQLCCPASQFQNISRTAHSLPRQQRKLR